MKVQELNRLDTFFLLKPVHKGTASNVVYQVVELTDEGIIARSLLSTVYGSINLEFYLPDFTEVEYIPLEYFLP